jgi:hypothetical protein
MDARKRGIVSAERDPVRLCVSNVSQDTRLDAGGISSFALSVVCQIVYDLLGQVAGLTFMIERLIMPCRAWYAKVK